MSSRMIYAYAVLRYVHDVVSGERLNVGVVLLSPTNGTVLSRFAGNLGRVAKAFPSANQTALKSTLSSIQSTIEKLNVRQGATLDDLLAAALQRDGTSLQWSDIGSGVTIDPDSTLEQLYERFVSRQELAFSEPEDAIFDRAKYSKFRIKFENLVASNDYESWEPVQCLGGRR